MADHSRLDEILARWTHFQECQIDRIDCPNFGYAMRIVFDCTWDDAGKIRSDLDVPKLVSVVFSPLYSVEYSADIHSLRLGEDTSLAPGALEISAIQQSSPKTNALLAVDIGWDWGGRLVRVEFDSLSVVPLTERRSS